MNLSQLEIVSPKRGRVKQGWEGFFPYYAGFSNSFASSILSSSCLPAGSRVLDPWNGSGTTTFAAAKLGLNTLGVDINPVMAIVARARLLNSTEADSLAPLAREIVNKTKASPEICAENDPLLSWFDENTSSMLRSLELHARRLLIGPLNGLEDDFRRISSLASSFYVALFAVARSMVTAFRSSNPTWTRVPKDRASRVSTDGNEIACRFLHQVEAMAAALETVNIDVRAHIQTSTILVGDTVEIDLQPNSIDMVLTSPPYCTRIDYAAATRVELAFLHYFSGQSEVSLSRKMLGSTRVPAEHLQIDDSWGPTATSFLKKLREHNSKASAGYYFKTHLDYFHKLSKSLQTISKTLKISGSAVLVIQDSHYKELHNDLPRATIEIAESHGLLFGREERFEVRNTLAGTHPLSRQYRQNANATESVLCLTKVR
ncbi:DNA methyltransferase [Rhizobium leguminosarum]|uniref:DNA methyltransferase n=1 Tax=Rhizobium leguminosarum TaxID=384 RepID=UPI003965736E